MGKKVLMVGAGSCQVNGINALKSQGHQVIVADYNKTSVGKQLADVAVLADAFKADEILACANTHQVDAVITVGTDQPLLSVVKTAEKLGLAHFITSETAYAVTNKRIMKNIFKDKDIPTVPFAIAAKGFNDAELAHIIPPYVIKPVDSQGQRGIFLVETIEAIREKFDEVLKHSREDRILIEAYYENEEITVSGWVNEGDATVLTMTDRVTFHPDEHIGVCVAHEYPSKFTPYYASECNLLTQAICDAFQIKEGPIYFQMLIGNQGMMVNEIACRLGGAFEDVTIPYVTGVDVLKLNIDGSLGKLSKDYGKVFKKNVNQQKQAFFSTQLFFCRPGKLISQTPIEVIEHLPFVLEAGYNFNPGDFLNPIESASQRAGYMIVTGSTEDQLQQNIKMAFDALKWLDDEGNQLVMARDRNERPVRDDFMPK